MVIQHVDRVMTLLKDEGNRLYRLLYRLTLRQDVAEDLLQELVLKLAASDGFANARSPAAYACAAATNLAFTWRRCKAAAPLEYPTPGPEPTPLDHLVHAEQLTRVMDELMALPRRDRLAITLRYLDGRGYRQVGEAIECSPATARVVCHRALRRLRAQLDGAADTPVCREAE